MKKKSFFSKLFLSSEEVISMFLGLVIVVAVIGLVFNYFQRKKGSVDVPGISSTENINLTGTPRMNEVLNNNSSKKTYKVKRGDNLWKISLIRYGSGYNWVDIQRANNLSNPGLITVGQELVLPDLVSKTASIGLDEQVVNKIEGNFYKVNRGDNLWKISVRAYGDGYQWTEVWKLNKNKLRDPNKLEIGMTLDLPIKR